MVLLVNERLPAPALDQAKELYKFYQNTMPAIHAPPCCRKPSSYFLKRIINPMLSRAALKL